MVTAAMLVSAAHVQLVPSGPTSIVGMRNLALSPDGKSLAFVYQGDIWVVPSTGGRAAPLTNHIEMEENPVWSPDGKWIAFSTNRNGNNDIYAIPVEGGQSVRLTWHSSSDIPSDWTLNGSGIVFRAQRDKEVNGLYTLDVESGRLKEIVLDYMAMGSPVQLSSGKVAYTRSGFPWNRPRYEGSAASQIWTFDPVSGKRQVVRNNGQQHLWPRLGPNDTLYCVTATEKTPSSSYIGKPIPKIASSDNANRTPNVYQVNWNGSVRRLTDFVGFAGTRFLTVARNDGLIAFENDGEAYTLRPGQRPTKVSISASTDDKQTNDERLVMTTGAERGALSPKGDKIAFVIRGEIWLVPVTKGKGPNANDAKQLTDWAGLDDEPIWAPDNKTLLFSSDRDGANRLYKLDTESGRPEAISNSGWDAIGARILPDKSRISWWQAGKEGGLFAAPISGGAPTKVIDYPSVYSFGSDPQYDWSPDSRYVAWRSVKYDVQSINITDTQTKEKVNVTRLNANHSWPVFSPDGKYLYFNSDRAGAGLYALPLQGDESRQPDVEVKYEKPTAPVKVQIDWQDIEVRSRRLFSQSPQGAVKIDPATGNFYYLSEGDVWQASYTGDTVGRLSTGGGIGPIQLSDDAAQIFFVRAGNLSIMQLKRGGNPIDTVAFRTDWTRDIRRERQAAFSQFWRGYNRSFYDPNFHGRDWNAVRARYEKLLPSVGHRNEIAIVLNSMIGELEASHTEVGPGAGNPRSASSPHLGFTWDFSYSGPGIKIKEIYPRSPGSYAKTKLSAGEVVLAINGKDVRADENVWKLMNDEAGRDMSLLVSKSGSRSDARTVKYRALSGGEWGDIVYRKNIDSRRKYVEEKSGGKITYVHISGMGGNNFETFNREAWQYIQDKKAVIIDVRNNGGGNISDRLIDMIERVPHSYYQDRDGEAELAPANAWNLPTVVMHAESSFSNAEMFPYAMRQRKLATTVGKATPGYVIWTYGFELVDGTSARMPTAGVYRMDGSPLENMGQRPDFDVDWTPEDFLSGRDPQLDKAIDVLLGKVK